MEPDDAQFYRINRAAYTVAELVSIVQWPFRLLLPYYILRLHFWKAIGAKVPAKDAIADRRSVSWLDETQTDELQRRHPEIEGSRRELGRLGFPRVCCIRWWDSHHPYDSYCLGGLDSEGSAFGGCVVMTNGTTTFSWLDFTSRLEDGRLLQHFSTANGGLLRPHPNFIINRCPGAGLSDLYAAHRHARQSLMAEGNRFIEGMTLDQAVRLGAETYTAQVTYWRDTGLLLPDKTLQNTPGEGRPKL